MDRCNCWFDAYKALYGECPKFDMAFTTCSGTVAPVDCAGAEPTDTSNLVTIGEDPVDPEEPVLPVQPTMPAKGGKARRRSF